MTLHRVRALLLATWWILWPPFAALIVRLAMERACANPYDLLPAITSNPTWVSLLAALYVAPHLWLVAAYVVTVQMCDDLLPGPRALMAVWRTGWVRLALMAALFAVEYAPMPVWRFLGRVVGCRP